MRNIVILGSTGSIGRNALEVVRSLPGEFKVSGLSTNSNIELLEEQITEFLPSSVWVGDDKKAYALHRKLGKKVQVFSSAQGLDELAGRSGVDMVLVAISGSAALSPLLKAIDNKADIALANKEALVMAGPLILARARKKNVKIIPIDSEQSAIWQCLEAKEQVKLKNIYLTASGGPFKGYSLRQLAKISVSEALRHPRWKMGKKITVDSATLMNKGLEIIEAMHLFGVGADKIKIVIHPQAIIHSMVEFIDGVVMAQLSRPDMRIPIQYALTYPRRFACGICRGLDFYTLKSLDFQRPDFKSFPCLGLAFTAAKEGGSMPCALNAANEIAVEEFLNNNLSFILIPEVVRKVMGRHKKIDNPGLRQILEVDSWARAEAGRIINN
ncbi:MAG: 1-deoxy-D-xylulose-5-phosphate reductoisomerase [Candidatus Omnitrophota bacterium]